MKYLAIVATLLTLSGDVLADRNKCKITGYDNSKSKKELYGPVELNFKTLKNCKIYIREGFSKNVFVKKGIRYVEYEFASESSSGFIRLNTSGELEEGDL